MNFFATIRLTQIVTKSMVRKKAGCIINVASAAAFDGEPAQTEYEVVEYAADNTARVVLKPITGRSHQLRVHMLALGHPILGDRFYASPEARAMAPRLLLHAEMLTITHPAYGNSMTFKAPADF